jgi:solute carrier family 3 protein 2
MEVDKQSPKELADGNIQLAEKKRGDHLPDMGLKENGEADDGADEKLVNEDGPLKTNNDASEVKFLSIDSQNGDAKIDVENVKIAFAGMGKEELMKFANDPFWVRLRWFLFIFFWLLWVAMLAGAVTIIIMAPKCASPAPLKWWEQSPLYEVFVPAFKDGDESGDGIGDLEGKLECGFQ